jgi:hypothetical protein
MVTLTRLHTEISWKAKDAEMLKPGKVMQFFLPEVPKIYYETEHSQKMCHIQEDEQ